MVIMDNPAASVGTPFGDLPSPDCAALVARVRRCVETIRHEFDRWTDPHAGGPGLYFVLVAGDASSFAEPMGADRWPVEECASVFASRDRLVDAATTVASVRDGAVLVHTDGTIAEEMARISQIPTAHRDHLGDLPYADWMGTRHMSALETSTRPEVLATITLSEEDGRVTVFRDGTVEDSSRHRRPEWS
jgi:hypothetical protein